ncbi:hypothetical protein [Arthrobacter sp. HLT1-21]
MQVYLAVPPLADTSTVIKVLRAHGADPRENQELTTLDLTSLKIPASMPRFWDQIEAVVAVPQVGGGEVSDSVLIDIGIAIGRQIPLIVLTEDDGLISRLAKHSVDSARASLYTEDALDSHLSLFLAGARQPFKMSDFGGQKPQSRVVAVDARMELNRIQTLNGVQFHAALEDWVADLLRRTGVAVAPTTNDDRGFDFVLSLPKPQLIFGPILVEVKGRSPFRDLEKTALRLQGMVARERATLGLLLYFDVLGHTMGRPLALPGVVVISVHEMFEALATETSLEKILWRARNEAAHKL